MFVVFVGAIITTGIWLVILSGNNSLGTSESAKFVGMITFWLWFTLLFANFAEVVAEGKGKAQAETLKKPAVMFRQKNWLNRNAVRK